MYEAVAQKPCSILDGDRRIVGVKCRKLTGIAMRVDT